MHREPGNEKPDRKKAITPSEKREAVGYLVEQERLSVRKACKIVAIPRSTYDYKAVPKDDVPVQEALTALTDKHVDIGFWQSYHRLRNKGFMWNHKRIVSSRGKPTTIRTDNGPNLPAICCRNGVKRTESG